MRKFLFVLLLAGVAFGQANEPYAVKGVKLGTSLSEWQKSAGAKCVTAKDDKASGEYACKMTDATFAGYKVTEAVVFYKGQLMAFYFVVANENYDSVKTALQQKFGKPKTVTSDNYHDVNGPYSGEMLLWDNGASAIAFSQSGADRDHSTLQFSHIALRDAMLAARKKRKANDI